MTTRYLSLSEMTARLGLRPKSITSKNSIPEPDVIIGKVRGWSQETFDRWALTRPGGVRRMVDTPNNDGVKHEPH